MCIYLKGEYSVKFEITEPTKSDEGNYKFVVQNEKGEITSDMMEVKEIPAEKGRNFAMLASQSQDE